MEEWRIGRCKVYMELGMVAFLQNRLNVSNLIIVQAHGPRGPKSLYYMLPFSLRVFGLTNTLTVKFIQVLNKLFQS